MAPWKNRVPTFCRHPLNPSRKRGTGYKVIQKWLINLQPVHRFHNFTGLLGSQKTPFFVSNFEMKQLRLVTKRPTLTYPTFDEFVSWHLDEFDQNKNIDSHLVPATTFCTPCLINFNVIAKFETLEDDQLYLIEKAVFQNIVIPEWKNSGQGKKTCELLQTYYSEITKKQLDGLYNYFRYDFEVIGYNPELYYSIVENPGQYTTEDIKPY